jgi:DNA gyrase/topoisomerase IV subunit B
MESGLTKQNYDANDIVSLSAGKAFRQKIGMYLSADRQEAINLGLRELIVNVQDEYEVYKPENPKLTIKLDTKNREVWVQDNMRGIPVGIRDDGINSLTAAFLIPHSGGKHTEGVYSSAVGINGEGNKIVCHTAEWLSVEVYRDNKVYFQSFHSDDEGARPDCDVKEHPGNEETGTLIQYKPDPRVYGDIFIDIESLRRTLKEMAMFSTGLRIELYVDGTQEVFYSQSGLIDGLSKENRLSKPFSYHYETNDCKVDLALQWVSKKGEIRGYANNLYMPDGGAFISGFKSSLTRTFNALAKTKYDGDTIRDVLDGFVSVKVKMGQFTNQQKTALANPEARTATSTAIGDCLKEFALKRKDDFDQVVELLQKVARAEAAAEKARQQVLNATKEIEKNQKKKVFASDKLKDAEFLGQDSTLLLVEGLSAASSIAMARDEKKYGILALRGKPINAFTNSDEKIFSNEEVKLLLSAMNIVPDRYSADKLRYGKIGICSDADADGYSIGLLIMCLLYKFAPQFVEEGRLCWLRSPLYIVTSSGKDYYYYTDEEYNKRKIKGITTRAKGLGALSAEQAHKSMFSSEFQRMETLIPDEESLSLLMELMGEDSEPKHDFIWSNIDFSTIKE